MTGRTVGRWRTSLAVGAGALLSVAMVLEGGFDGWLAELDARSARALAEPVAALEPLARAVERNPLQPRHRRYLDERLEAAVAKDGVTRVLTAAPSAPLPRLRFAIALAAAGAEKEAARLAADAVPRRREDFEVLTSEEILALGRSLATIPRCEEALQMFDSFHVRGGSESRTDAWRGRCLLATGHAGSAIAPLTRAAERSPDDRWVAFSLAEARLAVGQLIAAERTTAALVDRDPDFSYGWRLRARVLERQRRFADAEKAYGRAADLDPRRFNRLDQGRMWSLRGRIEEAEGRWREAGDSFARAASFDLGKDSHRIDEARCRLRGGEPRRAIEILEPLVAKGTDSHWASFFLAEARLAAGDVDAASAESLAMVGRWPDRAATWTLRGRVLETEARWHEAAEAFARAGRLDPGRDSIRVDEARCRIRGGEPQRAIEILEPLVAKKQASHWAVFFLGEARLMTGDLDGANVDSATMVERWPDFYHAWQLRGRVLEAMGRRAEAATSFERALELAPKNTWLSARINALRARERP